MNLRVLSIAELEAADAAIWYDDRSPGLGDDFLEEVERAFSAIRTNPEKLAPIQDYTGGKSVGRYRLKRFAYLLIVLRLPTELVVVAVCHVRRRPLYWLKRLS